MIDNVAYLLSLFAPVIAITTGIAIGIKMISMIQKLLIADEPQPERHIVAKPIEELMAPDPIEQDRAKWRRDYEHMVENSKPKDRCAYCGGKTKPKWHKCPNCGAPL